MATRRQAKKKYRLDSEPYASQIKEVNEQVHEALKKYGEPTLSREELRKLLAKELKGESLGDYIIKERESGL